MARIIKNSRRADEPVVVDGRPAYGGTAPKGERTARPEGALDFLDTVTGEIESIRDAIADRIADNLVSEKSERATELDQVAREARERAYAKGYDEAVEKERADRISVIDNVLAEAKRKRETAVRDLEMKIIELAVRLADHITHRTVEAYPETVETIISETLSHLIGSEKVVLKVSEDDYRRVREKYNRWLGEAGNAQEFKIEIDPRLRSGDCIVETEGGIIDAVIENRLQAIADELVKTMGAGAG